MKDSNSGQINFDALWEKMREDEQGDLIESSLSMGPETAILPALKGVEFGRYSVRKKAIRAMGKICSQIGSMAKDGPFDGHSPDVHSPVSAQSAAVCSLIFSRIKPGLSLENQGYYFRTLLGVDAAGPLFAFKSLYLGRIGITTAEKMVLTCPEKDRLKFVKEYLKASAAVRLKFAGLFKKIIQSVKDRKEVVSLYADLFDAGQDADPFLLNIDPSLRQTAFVLASYVHSGLPSSRIKGLKALAMMSSAIPADLLTGILDQEEDEKVRQTVYQIVEHASLGTYKDLLEPILQRLEKSDETEAFAAFRALIISGGVPLDRLLHLICEKYPSLMGHIASEISSFSKISFFFIQEMALHPSRYQNRHMDIVLAAVFGMIKKRPERVVRILKTHLKHGDPAIRDSIARFIDRSKSLLEKEREDMETAFVPAILIAEAAIEKPVGVLKSFFDSRSVAKKLESLKQGKITEPLYFEAEPVIDADLSGLSGAGGPLFFNASVIKHCDFSKAKFTGACFRKTIFYHSDLRGAFFDGCCFDGAFFIETHAEGARFENCSFLGAGILKCSFSKARMTGANLTNTVVSKSSFDRADLAGAVCAGADLSAVSFLDARLSQADFAGVNARFSRFPTAARLGALMAGDIQLNDRRHQLGIEDLPQLDSVMLGQIAMLIFSEFIHYGESKFFRQNRVSLLTAFDLFKPKQSDLFQIIPYLLHENVTLPGMPQSCEARTPCGIHDYYPPPEVLDIVTQYRKNGPPDCRYQADAAIEGLFTIGSVGSMAQTNDSDIDYWVCLKENKMDAAGLALLKKKLEVIEQYAWDQFDIQVTFFVVDIDRAKRNDFGDSSVESSGSAQALLLKEEFYRTMIHVAGKLPLWSVLPTAVSKGYYDSIYRLISFFPDFSRYMDLGDIHAVSLDEFFGATIWQLFKSLKSPFKSVLKMALLEKYIHENGKKPLLCSRVKDEWMNSGVNLKLGQSDAYYILLDHLIEYYRQQEDQEAVGLLQVCFFLKLGISKAGQIENTVFGLRRFILEQCMARWHWSVDKLIQVGRYQSWSYKKLSGLSKALETFMLKKYKAVNEVFSTAGSATAQISPEDRTVLGRKVYAELSRRPGKISRMLLMPKGDRQGLALSLKYHAPAGAATGTWELLARRPGADESEVLLTAVQHRAGRGLSGVQWYV